MTKNEMATYGKFQLKCKKNFLKYGGLQQIF